MKACLHAVGGYRFDKSAVGRHATAKSYIFIRFFFFFTFFVLYLTFLYKMLPSSVIDCDPNSKEFVKDEEFLAVGLGEAKK